MVPEHGVVVVAFDRFQLLDLAGPADVLRAASLLGASPGYSLAVATAGGRAVRSESGITITPDAAVATVARSRGKVDTLLVVGVGGLGVDDAIADEALVADLRTLARRAQRTTSVCTGAFGLAAAGLLDGRRATTHWASCDRLADHVRSAGVAPTAEPRTDESQALTCAHFRDHQRAILDTVPYGNGHSVGWPYKDARVRGLAPRAHVLVYGLLTRVPTSLRKGVARKWALVSPLSSDRPPLLESTDLTVAAIADQVGVRHAETLHRAFHPRLRTTPDRYRQHFRCQAS